MSFAALWLALAAAPLFANAEHPLELEPAPKAGRSSAECARCHRAQHLEWSGSRHAQSASNPLFTASWRHEPMQWCLDCHAPVAALRDEGVGCAACHLRDGQVLSARPPSPAALRAHPTRLEPRLNSSEFCGECHQFNFPIGRVDPVRYGPHPMQNTLAEWRSTKEAKSCQQCHPPHPAAGAHDLLALRSAVQASAVMLEGGEVRVTVRSVGVAHALPSGDPFRRLRIELCAEPRCSAPVASRELGRRLVPSGKSWQLADDWTVPPPSTTQPAERTVELAAPGASWLHLFYVYAARGTEAELEPEEREVLLLEAAVSAQGAQLR